MKVPFWLGRSLDRRAIFFAAGKPALQAAMQDRKRRCNAKARSLWKRAFMSLSSTPENGFFLTAGRFCIIFGNLKMVPSSSIRRLPLRPQSFFRLKFPLSIVMQHGAACECSRNSAGRSGKRKSRPASGCGRAVSARPKGDCLIFNFNFKARAYRACVHRRVLHAAAFRFATSPASWRRTATGRTIPSTHGVTNLPKLDFRSPAPGEDAPGPAPGAESATRAHPASAAVQGSPGPGLQRSDMRHAASRHCMPCRLANQPGKR